jgi:hypothetical protein
VDSEVIVTELPERTAVEESRTPSIGTIEMRLYVLRHLGDQRALRDVINYYERMAEDYPTEEPVGYAMIALDLAMTQIKIVLFLRTVSPIKNEKPSR